MSLYCKKGDSASWETILQRGGNEATKTITVMTLTGRGALVYEDGLQVIHLQPCIKGCVHWRQVGAQVNAERKTKLVASLDLHQLLHHTHKGCNVHHAGSGVQAREFLLDAVKQMYVRMAV